MNKELVNRQIELQNKVIELANINIVTCGNCGCVLLHELNDKPIDCACCDSTLDQCDCPDLWYSGLENYETNKNKVMTVKFETDMGSGKIEYIHRDETFKNDTFEIYVEETYGFYTEEDVIYDVEKNIYKYINI